MRHKLILIIILTLSLVGCSQTTTPAKTSSQFEVPQSALTIKVPTAVSNQEQLVMRRTLANFVTTKLRGREGFYTNYLVSDQVGELATGHELLSESSGLYLRHLALTGSKSDYQEFYRETKQLFGQQNQFSYRVNKGKQSAVNATVDDLRILRSLYEYQARHHNQSYQAEIKRLIKGLKQGGVHQGQLVDYYDPQLQKRATKGTLCYFDLKTLAQFESQTTLQQQLALVEQGYLNHKLPFYQTRYNYQTKKYEGGQTINTTESLLTILHLSEIGRAKTKSLDFLTSQVQQQSLANYYRADGQVKDTNQAVANYGLAYLIGVNSHRQDLKKAAFKVLQQQQITTENSVLKGGYGDPKTLATYSYNNLVVLLALDFQK
ncbi:hypothetical protein [Lapidilactobacillus wuchangensis]|uniref:hypothetical protein n=1 Tax=Lapidilactobacillus wuchangensis TaxID=2486001 RepID=UPI000F785D51|nr:hypothetical protein [Lapidilactobacillus wuchangensis]